MKKLTIYTMLALLLLMGCITMKAQEYVPIIQNGNEWNTLDVTVGMYNTYYNNVNWFSGDTIIDDVRYATLLGTTDGINPHQFALLKEEDGKVWERLNDQTYILLYDFTGEKIFETETSGDTFEYDFGDMNAGLYIIKVQMSDGSEFSERIVKK